MPVRRKSCCECPPHPLGAQALQHHRILIHVILIVVVGEFELPRRPVNQQGPYRQEQWKGERPREPLLIWFGGCWQRRRCGNFTHAAENISISLSSFSPNEIGSPSLDIQTRTSRCAEN